MNKISLFGPAFRLTVLVLILIELLSLLANWFPVVNSLCFIIITAAVFALSLYKLEYGLYSALAELFIGSKGHLFSIMIADWPLSIRMGIFAAVMTAWLIKIIKHKPTDLINNFVKNWYWLLIALIVWGGFMALWQGNSVKMIILDINAWLYLAYFGVFLDSFKNQAIIKNVWQIFSASVFMIAAKTLILLYIFSHNFPIPRDIYRWVRDTGVGEVTLLAGDFYRIFFQSHIYLIIGFFVLLCYLLINGRVNFKDKINGRLFGMLALILAANILSLSRSNWLGIIGAGVLFYGIIIFKLKFGWRRLVKISGALIVMLMLSAGLLAGIVFFPFPQARAIDAGSMLKERFEINESAISSRFAQLPCLGQALIRHPLIGSGWGTTITYRSFDPRILAENSDGLYTTYAFEWGYLDIMLKIGLLGLLIYLILIWKIWRQGWIIQQQPNITGQERALIIGLLIGLAAIIIIHGFSPYLNHPLGIGYILLMAAFFNYYLKQKNTAKQ